MTSILIIDDTNEDGKRAEEILKKAGYTIIGPARDGETGIALYKNHMPNLVMIDLIMEGMNGMEVLKTIKTEYPSARAILCTSAGQGSIVDLAMRSGANGYVVKPYNSDILVSAVIRALG
jgi:two-component system chemotaxis response regulator CheY